MGVGSGVVIDSDPAAECAECQLKTRFLTDPAPTFELIESLLWQGEFPRLELHLDRLQDSASYFGFPCDRAEVEAKLLDHAWRLAGAEPRKVRLLLDCDGKVSINSELLPANPPAPVRVCLAAKRTDSANCFYFHKTTHRPLYAQALAAAQSQGCGEVLFLNERGEVTEGAISNVFVQKDGLWLTPPVHCGLLAGVERRQLLVTRPETEERLLTERDLRSADAVWLTNAVRGLRRARMVWE
jgi:para-aminobenzoate synthetase/4-amino-4-deoxychorismate lyase